MSVNTVRWWWPLMRDHMHNEEHRLHAVRLGASPFQEDTMTTPTLLPDSTIRPYPEPINERAELTQDLLLQVATELYRGHCDTGISLDNWSAPRLLVEAFYGPIIENGV